MNKINNNLSSFARVPSVHKLLGLFEIQELIAEHGQAVVVDSVRIIQEEYRNILRLGANAENNDFRKEVFIERVRDKISLVFGNSLRPVLNLSGIILHTNLGRALLSDSAVSAINMVAKSASNLEYDVNSGNRNEREAHVEEQLCSLIGAEAVTIVNNNAASVMLVLNTLARRKEVLVSRGELIEIGGSFRLPDIMKSSNCKLREVGTTNRTYIEDYAKAISPSSALIFKAYSSNFTIKGFTKVVEEKELVNLSKEHNLPFVLDLGSGALMELKKHGLGQKQTPLVKLKKGIDVVTFSGDKLLGGPQCGVIAGRKDLIIRMKKNAMKRAMRCDKFTIAALAATLKLYQNEEKALQEIPTLRLLTRSKREIQSLADRIFPDIANKLKGTAKVEIINCYSQVGSGALPDKLLPSVGISIRKGIGKKGGAFPNRLASAFRKLPIPVIGRIHGGALVLDLRCLEEEALFLKQIQSLNIRADL